LHSLEGLWVKLRRDAGLVLSEDAQAVAMPARGRREPARPSTGSGALPLLSRTAARIAALTLALLALALLGLAATAAANEAQTILEKCGHNKPFSGYSQKAYREALKQMTTTGIEYGECESLIRKAEEAAAGGGAGTAVGTPSSNVATPLSPAERHAVQNAHRNGSTPVQVGDEPVRPGVVHADIASAVSTLPHSLFAVLAFMAAAGLVLAIGEVRKRVSSRRNS
jgi:hypothetical protein